VEDASGVLRELYSVEGGALDGAFDLVDGCVEAALVDLEGRLLGLADLLDDLFVAGAQLEVAVGLLVDDVGPGSTDDETLCRQRGIGSDLTVIG
jgi:hypothetical protein